MLPMQVPSTNGTHTLQGRVYLPNGQPRGYFQVVHGMTEHIARYHRFMQQMAREGFICFGYDHLGHGHTVQNSSELGYIAKTNGWRYLVQDVSAFYHAVQAQYGKLPYILMGHSMGSFIVRNAVYFGLKPTRLIIMGTGGPQPLAGAGLTLIRVKKRLQGERHVSKTIDKMAFGAYNHRFNKGDPYSWLTKDESVRKQYAADPLCTFKFSLSAMQDLITLSTLANKNKWFKKVAPVCPILLVSGQNDPVGSYGRGVQTVFNNLKANGANATLHLYPTGRHEILNDDCYNQVVEDITAFVAPV